MFWVISRCTDIPDICIHYEKMVIYSCMDEDGAISKQPAFWITSIVKAGARKN